ncbi:hypothetical protein [Paraburkholderia sp. MM5477-R1]|uniref:hypothetical protein n=1 Tax=Paraburkholderia sp. MM5477-R1 TaxID=2991062 RepID=UPI003D1C244E
MAASSRLSMLLDELEQALPALAGATSAGPAFLSELDGRLNGLRSLLANPSHRGRPRHARSPARRSAQRDGTLLASLF